MLHLHKLCYTLALMIGLAGSVSLFSTPAFGNDMQELLQKIEQGRLQERKAHRAREQKFLADKRNQQKQYDALYTELQATEQRSTQLEAEFAENDTQIKAAKAQLDTRLGTLKELFADLQATTNQFNNQLKESMSSAQYPDRIQELTRIEADLANDDRLPSIEDMQTLWMEMQRELVAGGELVRFEAAVVDKQGQPQTQEVIRLGNFNLLSNGEYLQYIAETQKLLPYAKQPPEHFLKSALNYQNSTSGLNAVGIDPSGGVAISTLVDVPTIMERIEQGGLIGYLILGLGALALLMSIERLIRLLIVNYRVSQQMRRKTIDTNNPLGRVLQVYKDNPNLHVEALELKLGEAILKERLPLERFISSIKIVAVVAPLLGLLGTVTGMINTFQAITLFGTGDPRLMAGGISQALVTTIEGLSVAVPIILMHSIVNSRCRHIILVLEEQSTGMVAAMAEREKGHAVSH